MVTVNTLESGLDGSCDVVFIERMRRSPKGSLQEQPMGMRVNDKTVIHDLDNDKLRLFKKKKKYLN